MAVPRTQVHYLVSGAYNPERYVPYRLLWAKVIIRAAFDYALWKESKDVRLKKCAEEAGRWLFEPSTLVNSFETICHMFDLPAELLRGYAKKLTREGVKKIEFRERTSKVDLINCLLHPEPDEGMTDALLGPSADDGED